MHGIPAARAWKHFLVRDCVFYVRPRGGQRDWDTCLSFATSALPRALCHERNSWSKMDFSGDGFVWYTNPENVAPVNIIMAINNNHDYLQQTNEEYFFDKF